MTSVLHLGFLKRLRIGFEFLRAYCLSNSCISYRSGATRRSKDLSIRADRVDADVPATCTAASSRNPPRKTDSRINASRSTSESKRQECSNVARMLRCRAGTLRREVVKMLRLLSSSWAMASQECTDTQAAASSTPSGIPSTNWQIRATWGASSESEKRLCAWPARCWNKVIAL